MSLEARRIIAEGEEIAGFSDPETHFHPNLSALIDSINDTARLSPEGAATTHAGLVRVVKDRLESLKWLRDYTEIADEEIEDPVFLCGLPRSGTTYFQYLFDNDRRFRLIRTWESMTPFPPPGHDPASVERRKAEERAQNEKLRIEVPGFDALHLIDEDGPQECHLYLEYGFGAAGYHNMHDVPAYFDYLMDHIDLVPVYQVHKRVLQLLQWKCPRPRWALKYPNHVIAMDAIRKVHPNARFVMTHRDPAQIVASIAKMTWSLRNVRQVGGADPHRAGAHMLHFIRRHIDRIMAFCTGPDAASVHHVDYYRLAADPAAMLDEIHTGIGADTPDDVRASIAAWRAANPQGARGENRYTLDQFGLDADAIREQFADYIDMFGIPTEAEGVAATQPA